jgi:predicted nucleic acid-binding protein
MTLALDASLTLTWCFEDEATPWSEALLERVMREGAVAASIWPLEVANGLRSGFLRRRIDLQRAAAFAQALDSLPIQIDSGAATVSPAQALALALQYDLTPYDATYVEVATRHGLALACNDGPMRTSAGAAGIEVL